MANILFLMLPTPSHLISCFQLAKDLRNSGNNVTIAGTKLNEVLIRRNSFEFYEFKYMPTFEVRRLRTFLGRFILSLIRGNDMVARFREFVGHIEHAKIALHEVKPTLVFIDEHLSHYYPYFADDGVRCYMINTKIFSGKSKRIPPFNSAHLPTNSIASGFISELIWWKHLLDKRWPRFLTKIAFLGRHNDYFQRRYLMKKNSTLKFDDRTSMYDYDNIANVPSIRLISDAFDFPWRRKLETDICLNYWNESSVVLPDNLNRIVVENEGRRPIVYCGVGTMSSLTESSHYKFLATLIAGLSRKPLCVLIISTGGNSSLKNRLQGAYPNIHILEYVPQAVLLRHCNAMVTHGGINSIKEGIQAGIPMLGVCNVHQSQNDSMGNISRLVHHAIGLRCRSSDSETSILNKLGRLINDKTFGKNVRQLREKMTKIDPLSKAKFDLLASGGINRVVHPFK